MAYTFSVNNTPSTGAVAIYTLISTLVTAGWTVKADSDGTTYASGGGQVTGGGTGAHGLGNNNAWVRIQAPATNGGSVVNQHREFVFQRSASGNTTWYVKYSASAGFTGGSPGPTRVPSATDEVVMLGAGTDASPTFSALFNSDGTYRFHVICGGSTELYSFYTVTLTTGGTTAGYMIMLDVMLTGSYPSSDPDPAVVYFSGAAAPISEIASGSGAALNVTNPAKARAWLGATSAAGILTSGTNNQNVGLLNYSNIGNIAGSTAVNPFTNKDDMIGYPWARSPGATAPTGFKGFSTLLYASSTVRTNMDTADVLGTKDRVFINGAWAAWAGLSPVI